jgi:two-component system, NarL family, nitrate/nitrite response regulator NarL
MAKYLHCFVSSQGDLLPRWREAFPSAIAAELRAKVSHGETPALVWVRLPADVSPAQTLRFARESLGDAPTVVLSDRPDDDEAIACFAAGARGYCNTHAVPVLLQRIADVVSHGGLWIGESLMQRLLQGTARMPLPAPAAAPPDWAALLTDRERQVAVAVAEGSSNKEIARKLGITERTIKAHTGAIFEKLGVRDRLQLSLVVHGRRVS